MSVKSARGPMTPVEGGVTKPYDHKWKEIWLKRMKHNGRVYNKTRGGERLIGTKE